MALLQNISLNRQYPIRQTGNAYFTFNHLGGYLQNGLNKYAGEANISSGAAVPNGYSPTSGAWLPQRTAKDMAIYHGINGVADINNSNLAGGKNAVSHIYGTGSLTNADLRLIAELIATLQGIGQFASDPVISGKLDAAATLVGAGDITGSLGAIADLVSTITGTGIISDADEMAYAEIVAHIYVNQSSATVDQIKAGVWDATAADFNDPGTMGNKMNSAGSAGDPWSTELPGTYTGKQAGKVLSDVDKKTGLIPALL